MGVFTYSLTIFCGVFAIYYFVAELKQKKLKPFECKLNALIQLTAGFVHLGLFVLFGAIQLSKFIDEFHIKNNIGLKSIIFKRIKDSWFLIGFIIFRSEAPTSPFGS